MNSTRPLAEWRRIEAARDLPRFTRIPAPFGHSTGLAKHKRHAG
ncbi:MULTISPECIES: hypothetical protein [Methylobacterium]|nr:MULTISPECIES: hypothetical protein [Methylobacterium]